MGHEKIAWDGGGKLSRNDVGFGIGGQMNVRNRKDPTSGVWSVFYAFRALVAEAPNSDELQMMEPTCAGPCDEPTTPSKYDRGLFFNMGFTWDR